MENKYIYLKNMFLITFLFAVLQKILIWRYCENYNSVEIMKYIGKTWCGKIILIGNMMPVAYIVLCTIVYIKIYVKVYIYEGTNKKIKIEKKVWLIIGIGAIVVYLIKAEWLSEYEPLVEFLNVLYGTVFMYWMISLIISKYIFFRFKKYNRIPNNTNRMMEYIDYNIWLEEKKIEIKGPRIKKVFKTICQQKRSKDYLKRSSKWENAYNKKKQLENIDEKLDNNNDMVNIQTFIKSCVGVDKYYIDKKILYGCVGIKPIMKNLVISIIMLSFSTIVICILINIFSITSITSIK